jgi:hypothetical protein
LHREERRILEEHAREEGCSIIINPYLSFKKYGFQARVVRLKTLIEFLESMPDDKVQVAINRGMSKVEHLTIVGDWFAAESVFAAMGKGYQHTVFTKHAPSVHSKIEYFDQEIEELLKERENKSDSSRVTAIAEIKQILVELENESKT